MKERWLIEIIADVECGDNYLWEHVKNKPHIQIYNGDDGLRELFEDGIHWHSHMRCMKEFDWKVIERKPIGDKEMTSENPLEEKK